jgi:hypothetical protein
VLVGGDIKGNRPETVACTGAGDENCVLLDNLDIMLGENCHAIIITELSKGY